MSMDELFQRANKYSILEDDLHATSHQALTVVHGNNFHGTRRGSDSRVTPNGSFNQKHL